MSPRNASNEIRITRVYDSPVKTVWDAWTDPKKAALWWGPRGFTLTTHSKELRAGGHWAYTMHGPDGTNYENKAIYHEVEPLSRLVYDHGGNDDRPPLFRVTVDFSEVKGGKTKMEMSMRLPTPEEAEKTRKFIKQAGGNRTPSSSIDPSTPRSRSFSICGRSPSISHAGSRPPGSRWSSSEPTSRPVARLSTR
jgi:uncharacterized protein YndB with AHSA1/START domain